MKTNMFQNLDKDLPKPKVKKNVLFNQNTIKTTSCLWLQRF